ncbi:MAG: terpene cyclase/mutase family protein [Planctomycetes bacterium]|nr:terpene cyclase/mutase family protein [Planctomycetota bacterium]
MNNSSDRPESVAPGTGAPSPPFFRTLVRNAPWTIIAGMIHVVLIAVLSVIYVAHVRSREEARPTTVAIREVRDEPVIPPVEPPESFKRDALPKLAEKSLDPTPPVEDPFLELGKVLPEDQVFEDATVNEIRGDPTALDLILPPGDTTGGTPIGVGRIGRYGTGIPDSMGIGKVGSPYGDRDGGQQRARRTWRGVETEGPLEDALEWLRKHQDPGGRWDCDGFSKHCRQNTCDGPGEGLHDIGVTGLALLAFLGDGNTLNTGRYRAVVARSVKWLINQQNRENGLLGDPAGQAYLYSHAIGTLALCEAYHLSGRPAALREPAQRSLNLILASRNPYKAWRYSHLPNGDNDTSVTGWMVFALKAGEEAGLNIDKTAYDAALAWFDEMTDMQTGRCGYQQKGEASSRRTGSEKRFPQEKTESLTAVALLCRFFLGQTPDRVPTMRLHADRLRKTLPVWEVTPERSLVDEYYWYYGTFAMFQMGGEDWKLWNGAMKKAIVEHQRQGGDENGSWDPVGAWGKDGGRVYMTAMSALCMEVYYRYVRVLGGR